jgi:hypothetical protein
MLAFVHIEKCGGTTLIDLLRRNLLFDHFDVIPRDRNSMLFSAADLQHLLAFRPTVKSVAGHSIRLESDLQSVVSQIQFITCLRAPERRYVSDYLHFVDRLDCDIEFPQWLQREDRHNFQTRAIAGKPDLPLAIQRLETRFSAVGVVERFPQFVSQVTSIVQTFANRRFDPWYEIQNTRQKRRGAVDAGQLLETYRDQIRDANNLDIQLYEHAINSLCPRQTDRFVKEVPPLPSHRANWARLQDAQKRLLVRVYRNLLYKPHVGHLPLPHRLPFYRLKRSA